METLFFLIQLFPPTIAAVLSVSESMASQSPVTGTSQQAETEARM